MPNVVQVEFFHSREDACYTQRAKTVVRLYDERGILTKLTQRFKLVHRLESQARSDLRRAPWGFRWYFSFVHEMLQNQITGIRRSCKTTALQELRAIAKAAKPVVIENHDYSFRSAKPDELEQILTRSTRARGAWVFVFTAGSLEQHSFESVAGIL